MSEVKFYVNSLSKKQLAEAYIHLRSRLERLEEKSARLERRAKDWAKEQVGFVAHTTNEALKNNMSFGAGYTVCKCCNNSAWSDTGQVAIIHAHDCDAAHILGLERESEK